MKTPLPLPERIHVTGCKPPQQPIEEPLADLPGAAFCQRIRELGGMPEALLDSPEFMQWYLPILRSDIRARERYRYPIGEATLSVPLHITLGAEELNGEEELPTLQRQWQEITQGPCTLHIVPGGHFFILERPQEVVQRLLAMMREGSGEREVGRRKKEEGRRK